MKQVIPIILVLIMAFAFTITTLADDEEEIVVLPPVDLGENEETGTYDNIGVDLKDPDPGVEAYVSTPDTTDWDDDDWDTYNEILLDVVDEYKASDVYDEKIVFDAIQYIAAVQVGEWIDDVWNPVSGVGGYITIVNKDWNINTVKAILQWFEGIVNDSYYEGYRLITDFDWDPATGTLTFWVDDFGYWSEFFALIQRGVPPAKAAKVLSGTSPQTSDNSIHGGIILLIVLSAAAATVVISRKARSQN